MAELAGRSGVAADRRLTLNAAYGLVPARVLLSNDIAAIMRCGCDFVSDCVNIGLVDLRVASHLWLVDSTFTFGRLDDDMSL